MNFQELINKAPKTETEILLCQAIIELSVQPAYNSLTLWEVFDLISVHSDWMSR